MKSTYHELKKEVSLYEQRPWRWKKSSSFEKLPWEKEPNIFYRNYLPWLCWLSFVIYCFYVIYYLYHFTGFHSLKDVFACTKLGIGVFLIPEFILWMLNDKCRSEIRKLEFVSKHPEEYKKLWGKRSYHERYED